MPSSWSSAPTPIPTWINPQNLSRNLLITFVINNQADRFKTVEFVIKNKTFVIKVS